jgi:hypothetical protein
MDKKLTQIRRKIGNIQSGLLRYRDKNNRIALPVKASMSALDEGLSCIVMEETSPRPLLNRDVNLVQRSHDDYLYIRGRVSQDTRHGAHVISIDIRKACWFVRKSKGNASWLQEECIYENMAFELNSKEERVRV